MEASDSPSPQDSPDFAPGEQNAGEESIARVEQSAKDAIPREQPLPECWSAWAIGKLSRNWLIWVPMFFAGVIGPALCLLGAMGDEQITLEMDPWQSGDLHMYASFLLSSQNSFPFFPFLLFAMVGCSLALWNFANYCRKPWVRAALYTGVVLSLQYWVVHAIVVTQSGGWDAVLAIFLFAMTGVASLVAVAVVLFVLSALRRASAHWGFLNWGALLAAGILLYVLVAVVSAGESIYISLGIPVMATLLCGPAWCLFTYALLAGLAWRTYGQSQFRLWQMFLLVGWLSAYFAAWRWAASRMLVAYAQLPSEQPEGCYIASAAAGGHRRLVGGWMVRCEDGREVWISAQLAWLKCGELTIRAACPGLHRALRRVYDRWGPPVARRLRKNAWLADAAYVSLKPFEWATRLVLWMLLGDLRPRVRQLYAGKVAASPRAIRAKAD